MFKTNLKCLVDGASETATPLAEYLSVYLGSILGLISISLTVFIYSLFSSSILLSSSYKQALVNLWISIVLFLGKNSMKAQRKCWFQFFFQVKVICLDFVNGKKLCLLDFRLYFHILPQFFDAKNFSKDCQKWLINSFKKFVLIQFSTVYLVKWRSKCTALLQECCCTTLLSHHSSGWLLHQQLCTGYTVVFF